MRPRYITIYLTFSLFAILLMSLSGCLEHRYTITALPNDGLNLAYQARGDLPDLEDGLDLFPDTLRWHLARTVEEKEDETTHILSGEIDIVGYSLLESTFDWRKSLQDSIYFLPQFSLKKDTGLFGVRYLFQCLLLSRDFDLKYGDVWKYAPPECRVLEDNPEQSGLGSEDIEELEEKFAAASIQWNIDRYKNRLFKVWVALKMSGAFIPDTSDAVFSIALAGWSDDLRLFLNDLDIPDPKVVDLEWWGEVKPMFLGRLVDLCGIDNAVLIRDLSVAIEKEYQISKDLKDDNFTFSVNIDGQTITTNGKKAEDGYYTWEVPGSNILNDSKVIELETYSFNLWRISASAILALMLLGILMRKFRTGRNLKGTKND